MFPSNLGSCTPSSIIVGTNTKILKSVKTDKLNLLQITSAHVYLTYPFVASWSLLDAMSCACPVIASSTEPVLEFIEHNKNGLLFDFYNINEQVEKIEYALNNKEEMKPIREQARNTIIENYDLKTNVID